MSRMGDYGGSLGNELRELDSLIGMLDAMDGTPEWWRISDWNRVKRALPILRESLLDRHQLHHLNERLSHMATQAQITELKASIEALIAAIPIAIADAVAKVQAPTVDPQLDALDATVKATTAGLTPPAA